MSGGFLYVWEYEVPAEHAERFEQAYGPGGEWVRLLRRGEGYLRTELHRDRGNPRRYLTLDYWSTEEAWTRFREAAADEWEALDRRCAEWTRREVEVGRFEPVDR